MKYRCVGYKGSEKYFTIGKVYDYVNGGITNDNGYTYEWDKEDNLIAYLSYWYDFVVVDEASEMPEVSKVIFNYPATIVFFSDGSKEVVQCRDTDWFDEEKGIAMALLKKAYGKAYYSKCIRPFLPDTLLRDYL